MAIAAPRRFDNRTDASRAHFVEAAIRVIDRNGPEPSMVDVAAEAGATKPRLYRQFDNQVDLYRAVAQHAAADIGKAVMPPFEMFLAAPREAMVGAMTGFAESVAKHPNLYRFLLRATADPATGVPLLHEMQRGFAQRIAGLAIRAFGWEGTDRAAEAQYVSRSAVGAVSAATDLWLETGEPRDIGQFVGHVCDFVADPVVGFFRRAGIDLDLDEPLVATLARVAARRT